jgi:hypothetical protein
MFVLRYIQFGLILDFRLFFQTQGQATRTYQRREDFILLFE